MGGGGRGTTAKRGRGERGGRRRRVGGEGYSILDKIQNIFT